MEEGPVPTKTLRGFLQKQYPNRAKISSTMVFNCRMKVKRLRRRYGTASIPSNEARKVFQEDSLEMAPENWDTDPIFADIYREAMLEVLAGDEDDSEFPIIDIMEKIRRSQPQGYSYRVYYSTV